MKELYDDFINTVKEKSKNKDSDLKLELLDSQASSTKEDSIIETTETNM